MKVSIQFLSHTGHISVAQYSHMADGYDILMQIELCPHCRKFYWTALFNHGIYGDILMLLNLC